MSDSNSHPHGPVPTCDCSVCRLIFPIEACDYCGARAFASHILTDGTTAATRWFCHNCTDALHRENEEVIARAPQNVRDAHAAIVAMDNAHAGDADDEAESDCYDV